MVDLVIDGLSWLLFVAGSAFVLLGAIGVLRFPDFYTRLHAAGITDTLGADLILLAMALQADNFLTIVKIGLVFIFILLTSPVSTHAIAHAAYKRGLNPKVGDDLHFAEDEDEQGRSAKGERA
ncbi:MAG: monovalent cation/H(+) antiporter subunit G [Pseudomonadota bacterium]